MKIRIKNGKVILRDRVEENLNVYYENGFITDVTDQELPCGEEIDAKGKYLSPGFIDIHSHGGGGADFLDGTPQAFLTAAKTHARHGTTTIVPTATSCDYEGIRTLDAAWRDAVRENREGADMPGLHLEGPYFSMNQRGAQDPKYIRNPDPKEYEKILDSTGDILRWSAAPELPGALEFGRELKRRGILAAIGHSDAEYPEVEAAYRAGYTHVTHLYSGMSMVHRRNAYRYAGVVESAFLIDGLTVEIIADGKHLPAELLRLVVKFKGPDKTALITDSMRGAGMPDGPSILGSLDKGLPVIIEDGVAKLPDRTSFAGSVATADLLVRNMVQLARVSLPDAVRMASVTPANIMGFSDRGEIQKSRRADLVLFDEEIHVSQTIVEGRTVWKA